MVTFVLADEPFHRAVICVVVPDATGIAVAVNDADVPPAGTVTAGGSVMDVFEIVSDNVAAGAGCIRLTVQEVVPGDTIVLLAQVSPFTRLGVITDIDAPATVNGSAVPSTDAPRVSVKDMRMDDPETAVASCMVAIATTPSVIVPALIPLRTQMVDPAVEEHCTVLPAAVATGPAAIDMEATSDDGYAIRNCNAAGNIPLVVKVIGTVTIGPGSATPGDMPNVAHLARGVVSVIDTSRNAKTHLCLHPLRKVDMAADLSVPFSLRYSLELKAVIRLVKKS